MHFMITILMVYTITMWSPSQAEFGYQEYTGLLTSTNTGISGYRCTCSCLKDIEHTFTVLDFDEQLHCHCNCNTRTEQLTMNSPELKQRLQELKQNLTIHKNQTNRAKREKISVYERTMFATGMGCFGILILTSIVIFIFILDIPDYINIFKRKFPFSKIIAFFLCLCIKEEETNK